MATLPFCFGGLFRPHGAPYRVAMLQYIYSIDVLKSTNPAVLFWQNAINKAFAVGKLLDDVATATSLMKSVTTPACTVNPMLYLVLLPTGIPESITVTEPPMLVTSLKFPRERVDSVTSIPMQSPVVGLAGPELSTLTLVIPKNRKLVLPTNVARKVDLKFISLVGQNMA